MPRNPDLASEDLSEDRLARRASEKVASDVHQAATVIIVVAARQHVEDSPESRVGLTRLLALASKKAAESASVHRTRGEATSQVAHNDWGEHRQ